MAQWSRHYLVPGMAPCGGGPSLDHFDMLSALVDWVEEEKAPESIAATGAAFPGRSRPRYARTPRAQYTESGDKREVPQLPVPVKSHTEVGS